MFAASRGISSRIVGAGRRNKDAANGGHRKRKRRKMTLKQRMYLPFMWSTCIGTFLGFVILCGGTAMCVVGYYAEYFATTETISTTTNGTDIVITKDSSMQFHIKNLTFVGPIFMGVGAFIIVVACVVVFETRDKVLDLMEEQQRTAAKRKPDFYDLIIAQMKKKEEDIMRGGQDNLAFDNIDEDLESDKIQHTCTPIRVTRRKSPNLTSTSGAIGMALREIGSNIFTIDTGRDNTLTPVPSNPFESEIRGSPLGPVIIKPRPHTLAVRGRHTEKYPSVSCIHDMMKASDDGTALSYRRHSWLDNVQPKGSSSKYEIAPLDIPLSSSIDNQFANTNSSNSKHQSHVGIDPNEEPSKSASLLEGKFNRNKSGGDGEVGFSSDEECSDAMSTRDTCLSVKGATIENEPLNRSLESDVVQGSKARTVVVLVHQAPVFNSHSDISEARSSSDNPSEMFKNNSEVRSSFENNSDFFPSSSELVSSLDSSNEAVMVSPVRKISQLENAKQEFSAGSNEQNHRNSILALDEVLDNVDAEKVKPSDKNIKKLDDGNSSDSSSNA